MRVAQLLSLTILLLGGSAYAAVPQCNDGIDNDGDGLIDFDPGAEGILVGADPQCRSLTWNSEASASDLGTAGVVDGSPGTDGMLPPGETAHDGSDPFEPTDGGTVTGGGGTTVPNEPTSPPRQGCDVGGEHAPALPILMVLAVGCGLALLSRRKRT